MTTKQMNAHSHTNNRNRHWRTKILVNCLSFWCKSDKATHYAQTRWSSRWQRVSHSRNRTLAQGIDVRNIQAIRCTDHSRYHSDVSWLSSSGERRKQNYRRRCVRTLSSSVTFERCVRAWCSSAVFECDVWVWQSRITFERCVQAVRVWRSNVVSSVMLECDVREKWKQTLHDPSDWSVENVWVDDMNYDNMFETNGPCCVCRWILERRFARIISISESGEKKYI